MNYIDSAETKQRDVVGKGIKHSGDNPLGDGGNLAAGASQNIHRY